MTHIVRLISDPQMEELDQVEQQQNWLCFHLLKMHSYLHLFESVGNGNNNRERKKIYTLMSLRSSRNQFLSASEEHRVTTSPHNRIHPEWSVGFRRKRA